ncbi:MAG: putative surface protein with fasciclin (FAS1) repeats, partial [Cyclobacteriaceae bacterium]
MLTTIKNLLIAMFIANMLSFCAGPSKQTEQTSADATEATHPKGQASVVDDVSAKNILQVAISSEAHTTLVAAVQAASIEHILVNAGPLTVFAPTNDAF